MFYGDFALGLATCSSNQCLRGEDLELSGIISLVTSIQETLEVYVMQVTEST